jgi:hypothetical protein
MHGPGRSRVHLALIASLTLPAITCGDAGKTEEKVTKTEEKKDDPAGKGGVEAWKIDVGKAAADDGKATPKMDVGAPEEAKAEPKLDVGGGAAAPDPATLIAEVKNKKTKDDRALTALTEAETAGAKPKDLARAAKARGDALFDTPDRAKPFFEWANEKDPKYPDAAFALAKQAVVLGELEETKKWLKIVHERKGKKLLQQLAFDPMWEIVKDDPEVKGWYEADG